MSSSLLDTGGYNQIVKGVGGNYYVFNMRDIYVGKSLEKYGEFSHHEAHLLMQLCGPGDVVIEVGANIGAHTVGLAKRVGELGKVLAFEPQRLVFQTLCANMAINSLTNVDCYWAAVGSEQGTIVVPEADPRRENNFGGVSLVEKAFVGQTVPCWMLDQLLSLPKLKLIKIDVEGMEASVLAGGKKLIQKFRPFLYVENDRAEKSEELIRLIDGLGYRMYWHLPPLFNPDNYFGYKEDIYPGIVSANMLCMPKELQGKVEGMEEVTDFTKHPFVNG